MGPLSWVIAILVIFASILVARWKPRYKVQPWDLQARKVNDSLYELHKPMGDPIMQILFFHGVPFEDILTVHLSTWESEDRSCLWPKTWLGEDFPDAHILAVSYNDCLQNRSGGSFGMYNIGENLISDLLQANIGQTPHCPVVLVGHSFGGLVIKKLCMQAQNMRISKIDGPKAKKFLDHVMGIFYYSTPHGGSPHINRAANVLDSRLIEYFRVLNTEAQQLNHDFNRLCASYPRWLIGGLGESLPVKSGLFRGVIVVPEASSRGGDNFSLETADHFSICKPENKTSRRFNALTNVLRNIAEHLKEETTKRDVRALEEARPQNLERLPEHMQGLDLLLEQVIEKLKKSKILGFAGMGGLGKTTLAKATFNELVSTFEYTCFVRDVKLTVANERELKEAVWKDMHCNGQNVGGEAEWSKLRGKKLLLIFDDISDSRDVEVLLDIADDSSAESRFIVTSRDRELLNNLGDVYPIPFLAEDNSQKLFLSRAFPDQAIPPPKLGNLVKEIVKKCEGLPLALEVLGKYLNSTENDEDWKQTLHALDKAEALKTFDERLWAKLRLSYDGLDKTAQQMFLDVATFFSEGRWTLGEAMVAWSEVYETKIERLLWKSLVDRSLVYSVEEDECIRMHEQMRSVGRKIASESNNNGSCRVWEETEALRLLQTTDEVDNKEIHSLRLGKRSWYEADEDDDAIHIAGRALQKLKKVRFLDLGREVVIDGRMEVEAMPSNLVLLKCADVRILNLALQGRLAVLHLHLVEDLLPSSIGQLSALRKLVLSAEGQSALPHEIGHLAKLEIFLLSSCPDLKSLPESFGNLSALKHLEFKYCGEMQALPESFGNLSALKHLEFKYCYTLQALPESFGNLSALEHLGFSCSSKLQALPESFGNLSALKHLEFGLCQTLQALPESFGNLSALEHLGFHGCDELQALPESFGNLSALEHLGFAHCSELQALPESFGNLLALKHLEFECCSALQALPESFGDLAALEHLEFSRCSKLPALPVSFGQLVKLQYLKISIGKIERLPGCLPELIALRHLILDSIPIESIPDYIRSMQSLHTVELRILPLVKELPLWLGKSGLAPLGSSHKIFQIQDGHFALTGETREPLKEQIVFFHKKSNGEGEGIRL